MPPVGGGLVPGSGASLRLPGQHFAASLLFLTAGVIGLILIAPDLVGGNFLSVHVVGVTHLFTLGWITTTIFGALYQLLPVALGAPVESEALGHISFWCHVPGVAVFVTGILQNNPELRFIGVALLSLGILLVIVNVGATLRHASARDVIWWAVVAALSFLGTTLILGVLLVENLKTGLIVSHRVATLAVHLHIALIGWVLIMVVGISHRLLPMFLLAHKASHENSARALKLIPPGLILFSAGLLVHLAWLTWIGVILLEAGVICFLLQARSFIRARMRPKLDAGLKTVRVALVFLAASALLGPVVLALGGGLKYPRLAEVYLVLGLLGGITLYVVGQYYKIVPFLAWIARFRDKIGKEKVPTVADLYRQRVAEIQLVLMASGVILIVLAIALRQIFIARAGGLVFLAGVILFITQVIRVMTVRQKPAPAAAPVIPQSQEN